MYIQPIKRKYGVKGILDTLPEFRIWIEQTKLFDTIKRLTNPEIIDGKPVISMFSNVNALIVSKDINMNLIRGISVKTPYDLPIELINQFYLNYPHSNIDSSNNQKEIYQQIKPIDNVSSRDNI